MISMDLLKIDEIRKNFNKYSMKAFNFLPKVEKGRLLDIGCGTGVPTILIATHSNFEITAIDIDQELLEILDNKIKNKGLGNRIKTRDLSLFELDFPEESFDVIWAEGSLNIIGFKRGLTEWKRFIKKGGFMVIHDDATNIENKLKIIENMGYKLIGHFLLPDDAWKLKYCNPLQKRIGKIKDTHKKNPRILKD
ncbi:MAG: class I SAM-dependent methyltransferase, partial [Promethearchaeota archaeon]